MAQTFEESVCRLLKKHRYSYYLPSKSRKYLPKRNENIRRLKTYGEVIQMSISKKMGSGGHTMEYGISFSSEKEQASAKCGTFLQFTDKQ